MAHYDERFRATAREYIADLKASHPSPSLLRAIEQLERELGLDKTGDDPSERTSTKGKAHALATA